MQERQSHASNTSVFPHTADTQCMSGLMNGQLRLTQTYSDPMSGDIILQENWIESRPTSGRFSSRLKEGFRFLKPLYECH